MLELKYVEDDPIKIQKTASFYKNFCILSISGKLM